jgi:hypothetical protein
MSFAQAHILTHWQDVWAKISYQADTWTTPRMAHWFMGIMGNWIDDDWKLVCHLIDFQHLQPGNHMG